MDTILKDIIYAWRMLWKNLGLTVVIVVLSLAIGIGANSAIFSVIDALLLPPPGSIPPASAFCAIGPPPASTSIFKMKIIRLTKSPSCKAVI